MASLNAKHRTGSRKSVEKHRVFVHFQQPVMYVSDDPARQCMPISIQFQHCISMRLLHKWLIEFEWKGPLSMYCKWRLFIYASLPLPKRSEAWWASFWKSLPRWPSQNIKKIILTTRPSTRAVSRSTGTRFVAVLPFPMAVLQSWWNTNSANSKVLGCWRFFWSHEVDRQAEHDYTPNTFASQTSQTYSEV